MFQPLNTFHAINLEYQWQKNQVSGRKRNKQIENPRDRSEECFHKHWHRSPGNKKKINHARWGSSSQQQNTVSRLSRINQPTNHLQKKIDQLYPIRREDLWNVNERRLSNNRNTLNNQKSLVTMTRTKSIHNDRDDSSCHNPYRNQSLSHKFSPD